jgi:hypothetical protein
VSKQQLWTVILDAVATVATVAIGIWVQPEYLELAIAIAVSLQGVAAALIVYYAAERKIEALEAEVRSYQGR